MEKVLTIIMNLGGIGIIGILIRFSVTFLNSKLIERKLQRREMQYLHNVIVFITIAIISPFLLALLFIEEFFPNLINSKTVIFFTFIFLISFCLQIINTIFINMFTPKKINQSTRLIFKWVEAHQVFILKISLLLAAFTSFAYFIFIIKLSDYYSSTEKIEIIISLSVLYLFLYIPYYNGLLERIKRDVLVQVHLHNGDVLTNLFLSHRSFGKDLVFYDVADKFQERAVTISKDNIQFILSAEYPLNKKNHKTMRKLSNFSARVIGSEDKNY